MALGNLSRITISKALFGVVCLCYIMIIVLKKYLQKEGIFMKKMMILFLTLLCLFSFSNNVYAKTKKVKMSKSEITLKCGDTKYVKLNNVKGKVKWKISNNKAVIVKRSGKYKNKIKIKAKKVGNVNIIGIYKKKKYICKLKIKPVNSCFKYVKYNSFDDDWKVVSAKTRKGKIFFGITPKAKNIKFTNNELTYNIVNKWFNANIKIKLDKSIGSVADCERKVNSIVKNIPNTLGEDYIKNPHDGIYVLQDLKHYLEERKYTISYADDPFDNYNLDSVWYTILTNDGCSYFWEKSSRKSLTDITYNQMMAESYNYIDGFCLYSKIEITKYNFIDLYNSYDTETEKRLLTEEKNDIMSNFSKVCNLRPFSYQEGNSSSSMSLAPMLGFENCLTDNTKLIQ